MNLNQIKVLKKNFIKIRIILKFVTCLHVVSRHTIHLIIDIEPEAQQSQYKAVCFAKAWVAIARLNWVIMLLFVIIAGV